MLRRLTKTWLICKPWKISTDQKFSFSQRSKEFSQLHLICKPLRLNDLLVYDQGIIHGDNAFKSKQLDLIMVFILQFATGKSNQGVKRNGRATRQVDIKMCLVGSMAFYLFYQFFK